MARRRHVKEIEVRPPRDERIIVYANSNTKKRWQGLFIVSESRNYEDFANALLDIYEMLVNAFSVQNIEEVKRRLEELLGVSGKIKVVK